MEPLRRFLSNTTVLWCLAALVSLVTLFYPYASPITPALRVQVLDENGNPAGQVLAKQEWGYYSLGASGEETKRTDDSGIVAFPSRSGRAGFAPRLYASARGILFHDGLGPPATLWAYGPDPFVWTSQGCSISDPTPTQIRLTRMRVTIDPRTKQAF